LKNIILQVKEEYNSFEIRIASFEIEQ